MNNQWFGIFGGLVIGLTITVVSFIFKINLMAINAIGQIPIYFWLMIVMAFLLLTLFWKGVDRNVFNWSYSGIAVLTFIYLSSMLQWTVECCPEDYDSMYDWNATKGLAWMVHLPIVFVVIAVQGLIFDILREKNLKRNL